MSHRVTHCSSVSAFFNLIKGSYAHCFSLSQQCSLQSSMWLTSLSFSAASHKTLFYTSEEFSFLSSHCFICHSFFPPLFFILFCCCCKTAPCTSGSTLLEPVLSQSSAYLSYLLQSSSYHTKPPFSCCSYC